MVWQLATSAKLTSSFLITKREDKRDEQERAVKTDFKAPGNTAN